MNNLTTDFGVEETNKFKKLIKEVDEMHVDEINDNYKVRVHLKDSSLYSYVPRKFALSERIELRKITDNLLERGIIKVSISPYCARVVPVRKKDKSMRLCVGLRPLNSRVAKQKYSFPSVEDHLSRLAKKCVFTLLDWKDGFHQIHVYENDTKFFPFATPDGQFEYMRLPFGFCKAPAEFQKRIVQVLQPLIREDKVFVYIDDILIPSVSLEEN